MSRRGRRHAIGKSALAAAIQVGAVVIAADGTITVDRAVLGLA